MGFEKSVETDQLSIAFDLVSTLFYRADGFREEQDTVICCIVGGEHPLSLAGEN